MKRTLNILILMTAFVFVFSACDHDNSHNKDKTNTVTSTDLTKKENAILTTTSDQSFVFDFNIDHTYDEITVLVEKYKKGELDKNLTQLTVGVSEGEGSIIVTTQRKNDDINYPVFNVGVSSGGTTGSTSVPDYDEDYKQGMMSSLQENDISIENGEAVLAGIIKSENDHSSISLRSNFYEDSNEMKKYDVVYLIKAKVMQ